MKTLMLGRLVGIVYALLLAAGASLKADEAAREDELQREITSANDWLTGKDKGQYDTKMAEMKKSAFAFYRATAHLYYHDLATGLIAVPAAWRAEVATLSTWICGDFHMQNVGFVDAGNGGLVFQVNDFDEALPAPFYWDVIRCVASVFVVKDSKDWPVDKDDKLAFSLASIASGLAGNFVEEYLVAVESGTAAAVDENMLRKVAKADGIMIKTLDKMKAKSSGTDLAAWWEKQVGSADQSKFVIPQNSTRLRASTPAQKAEVRKGWPNYEKTVAPALLGKTGYFEVKDAAERLGSGLGSLGVTKIYVLIDGPTQMPDDNILLECKECGVPAMIGRALPVVPDLTPPGAERVALAMRQMLSHIDPHEGWFTVTATTTGASASAPHSYHVSRMSPAGDGVELGKFKDDRQLNEFLEFAARALASAHCHATPDYSKNLQKFLQAKGRDAVKQTLVKLGADYGERVVKDFDLWSK